MNRVLLFISAFLILSCSGEPSLKNFPDNERDFSQEILAAIQTSDVQRLYAIQVPPEVSAKYGFYDYVRPDEMMTVVKSPEDFVALSLKRAEERKSERFLLIKEFFERMHREHDWQEAKIVSVSLGEPHEREVAHLLTKRKVKYSTQKLKIVVALRSGKQLTISTPFATKFGEKWILYTIINGGVDVREGIEEF